MRFFHVSHREHRNDRSKDKQGVFELEIKQKSDSKTDIFDLLTFTDGEL